MCKRHPVQLFIVKAITHKNIYAHTRITYHENAFLHECVESRPLYDSVFRLKYLIGLLLHNNHITNIRKTKYLKK